MSATAKPMPHRIAEAHGHLALGNVALAIESFRKALREQPDSVDAMVGLAASYDRMTRFDLSRRYYESALAIVPSDTRILHAFARSLDVQGRSVEAAAVRSEIRTRSAAAQPSPAPAIQPPVRQQAVAQAQLPVAAPSVTIKLPPPRPVAAVAAQRPAAAPRPSAPPATVEPKVAAVSAAPPAPVARKPVEPKAAPLPVAARILASVKPEPMTAPVPVAVVQKPVGTKPIASPPRAPAVVSATKAVETVAAVSPATPAPTAVAIKPGAANIPASRPPALVRIAHKPVVPEAAPALAVPAPKVAPRKPVELAAKLSPMPATPILTKQPVEAPVAPPQPAPAPVALAPVALVEATPPAPLPDTQAGPRLERLSLGEVALITTDRPQWRSEVVSRTAQSTTVRFVPLRKAQARPVIRLLNAARHDGLAARTRRLLVQRGWRQLAIGNARHVRQSSLVLYPANQRRLAKRLAAQFGIALAENADGTDLIVLLGRDAARRNPARGG